MTWSLFLFSLQYLVYILNLHNNSIYSILENEMLQKIVFIALLLIFVHSGLIGPVTFALILGYWHV